MIDLIDFMMQHFLPGITLNILFDSRIRSIICKGPKYRFPLPIDFKSCREEIAGALQEICNRWCKREHVESNALNVFFPPNSKTLTSDNDHIWSPEYMKIDR